MPWRGWYTTASSNPSPNPSSGPSPNSDPDSNPNPNPNPKTPTLTLTPDPNQVDYGFVELSGDGSGDGDATLTARGSACAAFADGHPLIVGTIIADGWLPQLSQAEVCAWLCLFIKDSRLAEIDSKEQPLPKPSPALQEVFGATFELAEILEVELNTN